MLKPEQNNLTIREDKKRGVFVEGLSEWVVRSPAEIYGLMERGGAVRATGETKMNGLIFVKLTNINFPIKNMELLFIFKFVVNIIHYH